MVQDLINRREQVMNRADKALDAAWSTRQGDDFVREMRWAAGELETIIRAMQAKGFDRLEQSRTYRYLGGVYADLEPALGKEMLLKAKQAYQTAEALLVGQSDELERAKLNFNFGNCLRQIDPNDIEQLQEAQQRLLGARTYFVANVPQYLAQVDSALQSVESLLRIAPLANAVKQNTEDMAALQKELAAGGNVGDIAKKARKIMKRGGGIPGMVGQLQAIIRTLSDDQRRSDKFADIQKQMQALTQQALGNDTMAPEVKQIWSLLNERLKSGADRGAVSKERAESLSGVLEEFGGILSGDEGDAHALLSKLQKMKEFTEDQFEVTHYLSHGIERPPAGSRAAELVELNWPLRRYLLEEMNRPERGEDESKEALELSVRASRVDKRIYEAGADNSTAMTVEKDEFRPLVLAVRDFSARMNTMPARPMWGSAKVPVGTSAVFYSGGTKGRSSLTAVCRRLGFEIMTEPRGESYANARWKQLQKAFLAVFDLRVLVGQDLASVTYELGIGLTLGKPVAVLVAQDQAMPFDVDIDPFILPGGRKDGVDMATALDRSSAWTHPRPAADSVLRTMDFVLSSYPRPQKNVYADQTLRMLDDIRQTPDPLAMTRMLTKFFEYLKDDETMLVHPLWSPVYPENKNPRLFHVMPFGPKWANQVAAVVRKSCEAAGIKCVRGDEAADPNVIRSIWEEIARATFVLADLTGFNPNVALELGIAHTLGKKVLMTGQGDPLSCVFPSISKLRVKPYNVKRLEETLGKEVTKFLSSD